MPLAADEAHIWISDYERVATYDRASGEWTTAPLLFDRSELAGMRIAVLDGTAFILVLHCRGNCDREEEDVPADIVLLRATGAGTQLDQLTIDGPARQSISGSSLTSRFSVDEGTATFGINNGAEFLLVTVNGQDETSSSITTGQFAALCPTAEGWVAVEHAPPGAPGAVSFQLPSGTSPDQARASASMSPPGPLRALVGTTDGRVPLALPPSAAGILADQLWLGIVCLDNGMALVGHHAAAEYSGGQWHLAGASLTREPMAAPAGQTDRLPDGTLLAATGSGTLVRSPSGNWTTDADPLTRRVAMGDEVLEYTQPAPSRSDSSPGPPQRKVP